MTAVGRYSKLTAKEGQGAALADKLVGVAALLEDVAGCELYVVNRAAGEPDVVWVTEAWRSRAALEDSLEVEAVKAQLPDVLALLGRPVERIELKPLGGTGLSPGGQGFTLANLGEVEDQAPKHGFGEMGEARFARGALGATRTGISLQRLRPGVRQFFAHRHRRAEEVVVVLGGSGRIRVDDEIAELRPLDAVRIAPESTRALEAGPDGLEFVVVGAHHTGDAEVVRDFWPPD